jgi:hypothetical protein
MAETSSKLTELVVAASRGDIDAFEYILLLYRNTPPQELPHEVQLLDAHELTDLLVANVATVASFDDKIAIMCGLQFICCINAPKSNPDVVIDAGGLEQVVQVGLRSTAARLQAAACLFFCRVCVDHELSVPHARAIISSGAMPLLCQLLGRGKTSDVKEQAVLVLSMLEVAVPGSTLPALMAAKAAKPITQLLASLRAGTLFNAASLLHALLTTYPTEALPLAAKAGAVRHLVVLLGSVALDMQLVVCCCIADMAQDKQCSRALAAAGAVPKLVAVLEDAGTPPGLLQAAAAAVSFMAGSGVNAQLRQAGAVRALVAALRRYDSTAVSVSAARAQAATGAATEAAAAAAAAASSNTTDLMQAPSESSSAAAACLQALVELACPRGGSQQQKAAALQAVASAGGLTLMVRLMRAADTTVVVSAASNAAWLTSNSPTSSRPLAEAGAIEALAALLPGSLASALPAEAALVLCSIAIHSPEHFLQVGQAVCSAAGWDTLLAGMLSGRESFPAVLGFDSPAEQACALQEAALLLLCAVARCPQQADALVAQTACEALPALVQMLPSCSSAAAPLLRTALSTLPQYQAAAMEAGSVPALLQLLRLSKWGHHVGAVEVLQLLAALRSWPDALMEADGVAALTTVLQQHLQLHHEVAEAARAAGAAALLLLPEAASHNYVVDSILSVLYATALHEAHTAAVQAALQPLAPQLAQLLAQRQARQQAAGESTELHSTALALVLALLQPPAAVLQAAGPGVAPLVAAAVPVLQQHRLEAAADEGTAPAATPPTPAAAAAAAAAGGGEVPGAESHDKAAIAAVNATCAGCGARSGQAGARLQACGRCRAVSYCSKACQRVNWPQHKGGCEPAWSSES